MKLIKNFFINRKHILLIRILIISFLIKNSNILAENINRENIVFEDDQKIQEESIYGRKLNFQTESLQICSKSSEKLKKYFETGDTENVKLYELEEKDETKEYIITLINILSNEGNFEENINKYISHLILVILFFIVSLIAIPGWIVCCSFSCCKCCFCCCLKKQKCRIPFFIIVSIMNLLIIIICIFGIIKTSTIFKGLSNAECSILRFISEVLDGESKNAFPKWGGIDNIINMLGRTSNQINYIDNNDIISTIRTKTTNYDGAKTTFETKVKDSCDLISTHSYTYTKDGNTYILDMVKKFGKLDGDNFIKGYFDEKWIKQANFTDNLEKVKIVLTQILESNIKQRIIKAQESIEDMRNSFEEIKKLIGIRILNYSEKINDKGKLIFNLIFSLVLIFSIIIEIILIFLVFFSNNNNYSCFFIFSLKVLIHILWNILSFLTIVIFLLATLLTFTGYFGEDLFNMFSFIFSKKNLNSKSPIIIGDGAITINACINEDGIIADELGIKSDLDNFDILKTLIFKIDSLYENIILNKNKDDNNIDSVYNEIIKEIDKRKNVEIDFGLIEESSSGTEEKLMLKESVANLNQNLEDCEIEDKWKFSCDSNVCTNNLCINPKYCYNELRNKYSSLTPSCNDANNNLQIIFNIFKAIEFAENIDEINSIKKQSYLVRENYKNFLGYTANALNGYTSPLKPLIEIYNNFVGNGPIIDFINCSFLGKNFKVMLYFIKNLKILE